jgi:CheY-like chemotaxis protein
VALKILLADDSMIAQNMGKKILTDAGYDVVPVSNGAAAVKRLPEIKPDIVLLDVYMPGYTGLEVCEKIKAFPGTAQVPVLLTVGKLEPFRAEDGIKVKADGVIVKPFEATDLVAVVAKLAERIWSAEPRPKPAAAETLPPQAEFAPELKAPAPDWVDVPREAAAAPAVGEGFLNEFLMDSPAAAPAAAPAPAARAAPVFPADVQAGIAGLDFLAPEAPAAAAAAGAVESAAEVPPIEIYLEPMTPAAEEGIEFEELRPSEPVASLPELEPTILQTTPEIEVEPVRGLVSDFGKSPVDILSEAATEPADAAAEEPPEFALFNSVLAADAGAPLDEGLAAAIEAYDAALNMAQAPPAPSAEVMEPPAGAIAEAGAEFAAAGRVTDAAIPGCAPVLSPPEGPDAIGQALEAMLATGAPAPDMEGPLPAMEALDQAVEIISESSLPAPATDSAVLEIPAAPEPLPPEALEIRLEPIGGSVLEETVASLIAGTGSPATEPAEANAPAPSLPDAQIAPAMAAPAPVVPLAAAAGTAEQIVDRVLQRIRPELVEEVKRFLARE